MGRMGRLVYALLGLLIHETMKNTAKKYPPTTLRLILGDQLNEQHSWFQRKDPNVLYALMEIRQETDYVKHHIQKVAVFFAAMRAFAARLKKLGHRVAYLRLDDPANQQALPASIHALIRKHHCTRFEYLAPDELNVLGVGLGTDAKRPRHLKALSKEHGEGESLTAHQVTNRRLYIFELKDETHGVIWTSITFWNVLTT